MISLGQPDLYIAGRLMQTHPKDPQPALAGLRIDWGTDSMLDLDPASTLSGQLLIKGKLPEYLHVGTPVGVVDPSTSRTLFAGTLQPLRAVAEPAVAGAMRVSFTAASPFTELEKHTALDVDFPQDESAAGRLRRVMEYLPAGWLVESEPGLDWILQGQQRYQSIDWLTLAGRYARGNLQRISDASTYVPGVGLRKRISITAERPRSAVLPAAVPGEGGIWSPSTTGRISGTAILPSDVVSADIEWEKTPADVVTAVQVTTWGMWLVGTHAEDDSFEHEWPVTFGGLDTSAAVAEYGLQQARIETSLSAQNVNATKAAVKMIQENWLDTRTAWRPTTLRLPDSRKIAKTPLLNLLACSSRAKAGLHVPGVTDSLPAPIRAYVLAGSATWTGTHWTTDLTLGRPQI